MPSTHSPLVEAYPTFQEMKDRLPARFLAAFRDSRAVLRSTVSGLIIELFVSNDSASMLLWNNKDFRKIAEKSILVWVSQHPSIRAQSFEGIVLSPVEDPKSYSWHIPEALKASSSELVAYHSQWRF